LLIFKTFSYNEKLFRIANIFNNKTQFKNIYAYLTNCCIIEFKNKKETTDIITPSVIKQIIMPGSYGQTIITLLKRIKIILNGNKS